MSLTERCLISSTMPVLMQSLGYILITSNNIFENLQERIEFSFVLLVFLFTCSNITFVAVFYMRSCAHYISPLQIDQVKYDTEDLVSDFTVLQAIKSSHPAPGPDSSNLQKNPAVDEDQYDASFIDDTPLDKGNDDDDVFYYRQINSDRKPARDKKVRCIMVIYDNMIISASCQLTHFELPNLTPSPSSLTQDRTRRDNSSLVFCSNKTVYMYIVDDINVCIIYSSLFSSCTVLLLKQKTVRSVEILSYKSCVLSGFPPKFKPAVVLKDLSLKPKPTIIATRVCCFPKTERVYAFSCIDPSQIV